MSQITFLALGALLVYLAVRVARIKRKETSFPIAYLVFVTVLLGGGVGLFIGTSWAAVALGLEKEPALVFTYGFTAAGSIVLWFVARRLIAGRK